MLWNFSVFTKSIPSDFKLVSRNPCKSVHKQNSHTRGKSLVKAWLVRQSVDTLAKQMKRLQNDLQYICWQCPVSVVIILHRNIVNKEVEIKKLSLSLKITSTCIRTYQQLIFTGKRKVIMISMVSNMKTPNQKHLWSIRLQRKTTQNFKVKQEWTKFV